MAPVEMTGCGAELADADLRTYGMGTMRMTFPGGAAGRAGRAMLAGRHGAGVLAGLRGGKVAGLAGLHLDGDQVGAKVGHTGVWAGVREAGGKILGEAIGGVRELPLRGASLLRNELRDGREAGRPVVREQKQADADTRSGDTLLSHNASGAVVEKTAEQLELERLATACRGGDTSSWQQLVTSQHRRVYGICFRFTGNASDAEDLTQDVFIKVYKNLETFDGTKGSFTTWLTTLTRNLLVDHFRRTRQDRLTDSIDASQDGESDGPTMADRLADKNRSQHDNVAQQEMRAQIQHALKQISPELREAVILRDLQDMDYKEIAQVLRVPEGTVKSRISRGRAELARLLQRTQGRQVM